MELQDEKLKDILSHSKLELPFLDFDNCVMQRIQEFEIKKKKAEKNKFFGHLSFLFGTLFGIVINYILSERISLAPVSDQTQEFMTLCIQLMYVLLIVLFADKILKLLNMDVKKLFK